MPPSCFEQPRSAPPFSSAVRAADNSKIGRRESGSSRIGSNRPTGSVQAPEVGTVRGAASHRDDYLGQIAHCFRLDHIRGCSSRTGRLETSLFFCARSHAAPEKLSSGEGCKSCPSVFQSLSSAATTRTQNWLSAFARISGRGRTLPLGRRHHAAPNRVRGVPPGRSEPHRDGRVLVRCPTHPSRPLLTSRPAGQERTLGGMMLRLQVLSERPGGRNSSRRQSNGHS
jgi:hypothetical protein